MLDYTPRYIGRDGQPVTSGRSAWNGLAGYQPAYQSAPRDGERKRSSTRSTAKRRSTKRRSSKRKAKSGK